MVVSLARRTGSELREGGNEDALSERAHYSELVFSAPQILPGGVIPPSKP